MTGTISSMADLCNYFGADDPSELNKRVYKGTECGASISVLVAPEDPDVFGDLRSFEPPYWIHNRERAFNYLTIAARLQAFTIQTTIEGSDATVDSEPFVLPVEESEVSDWVDYMEGAAEALWREANEDEEV